MNGYELWRLREFGLSGVDVQRRQSGWWSKHNCPVNRRFGLYDKNGHFAPPTLISSDESLKEATCSRLPQIFAENHVDLGRANKVFASQWISDDQVVMGTKCNSLLLYDARKQTNSTITRIAPLKSSPTAIHADQNCGIHAVHVNPSRTMLATGGENPCDIAVYRLPSFEPVAVGEGAHADWIFDLKWLDDEFVISGSRDSTLALFRFRNSQTENPVQCCNQNKWVKNGLNPYPVTSAVFVKKLQKFDKVRALTYNKLHKVNRTNFFVVVDTPQCHGTFCKWVARITNGATDRKFKTGLTDVIFDILTSVSLNNCLYVLDMETFRQVHLKKLNQVSYSECVCLCHSSDENSLAVGSRSHFTFFDARNLCQTLDVKLPNRSDNYAFQFPVPSGVRSLSWRGPLVTLGTGGGEMLFYDVRACKFLECDCERGIVLKITGGYLQRDEIFQEIFMNLHCPNAVYTHCYDSSGTRLFAAGGPIAASLVGNYAAMWQ